MIDDCNLHEIPLHGYPYMWERGRGTSNWVQERLDRVFVTETWLCIFPLRKLTNLVAGVSDHSPILLNTMVADQPQRKRRFRFENAWLMEDEFQQTAKNNWDTSGGSYIISRLGVCSRSMDA